MTEKKLSKDPDSFGQGAIEGVAGPVAMVLGPMIESSFRQSMIINGGNLEEVIFRPICLVLYLFALLGFLFPVMVKGARRLRSLRGSASASVENR